MVKNWTNVTPKGMPEWVMFNSIDVDPFRPGGAYVAGTRYKLGDYTPYLFPPYHRLRQNLATDHQRH